MNKCSKQIAFLESWTLFMNLKPDQHPIHNTVTHDFLLSIPLSPFSMAVRIASLSTDALPHGFCQFIAFTTSLLSAYILLSLSASFNVCFILLSQSFLPYLQTSPKSRSHWLVKVTTTRSGLLDAPTVEREPHAKPHSKLLISHMPRHHYWCHQ